MKHFFLSLLCFFWSTELKRWSLKVNIVKHLIYKRDYKTCFSEPFCFFFVTLSLSLSHSLTYSFAWSLSHFFSSSNLMPFDRWSLFSSICWRQRNLDLWKANFIKTIKVYLLSLFCWPLPFWIYLQVFTKMTYNYACAVLKIYTINLFCTPLFRFN